jgi:gamma-glutamyltranspeptidase/glutathione hydrolase
LNNAWLFRLCLATAGCGTAVGAIADTPVPPATAKHSMIAAADPRAVEAGLLMLDRGGTAVDAAIAVQMVLNLVEPQSSGIGGGAFLVHFDAGKSKVSTYDGRETAPMRATPELFLDRDGKPLRFVEAVVGGRSVGVPGLLRMLEMSHARHGKLPWASLFAPAIALAESGFQVTPRLHRQLSSSRFLRNDANARAYFYQADGSAKPVGTLLKNPEFAAVLKRVAREGADAFYLGPIARDISAAVRNHPTNPGTLSEDDLKHFRARSLEPICGNYRDYKLCGMPPPSSGAITLLQIMQLLEPFNLKAVKPGSAEAVHLLAEAGRLAYADRDRYVADEAFTRVPVAGLINPAYNHQRSKLILTDKSMGRAPPGTPAGETLAYADDDALELAGTSHISIVDKNGDALAMTTTIEAPFGCQMMVHGFLLNNELTDFALTPRDAVTGRPVANAVFPGKRPRSSMSPTLVFDRNGKLIEVIGSRGGHRIIHYVAQVLIATLDWGMDMQAAVAMPHYGSRNGPTEIEERTDYERLVPALKALGHDVSVTEMASGLHGIIIGPDGLSGGADPRVEGVAKGR